MTEVEGGLPEPDELEPVQGSLDLAAPEDRHTREEWEAATAAVLRKGRRLGDDDPDEIVWDKLTRSTLDGIAVTPLGTPDLLEGLVTSGRPTRVGAWDIRVQHGDGLQAPDNDELLVELAGGATSLWLGVHSGSDFAAILDGVLLDLAPVVLRAADDPIETARAFLAHVGDRELAPGTNLGVVARAADETLVEAARLARQHRTLAFVVDGNAVHCHGASDVQELAASLASATRLLRVLEGAGIPVTETAELVEFRYAVTDEQFPSIAKLRAARRLWARVLELSGGEGAMRQHAVTSAPMMTRYDPYVNMLRTTVAGFAAGVGGAEAVTVLPFDLPLGRPDSFGRRIARNTSHLLVEESHLAKVADPAGGAYAVEKLTDDLAVAAWELFGRLEDGLDLAPEIDAVVERREREIATRKRPLTGLSEFPHLAEVLPERPPYDELAGVRSYGESFEAMRDTPPDAHVFLATLGPIAQHTARATFATNLLAAGGVAVDVAGATQGPDDLVAAYAGQRVVCLAGADGAYADWGPAAAEALRAAGASYVVVAGKPAEHADDSCAMGVDALAFLTRVREQLS